MSFFKLSRKLSLAVLAATATLSVSQVVYSQANPGGRICMDETRAKALSAVKNLLLSKSSSEPAMATYIDSLKVYTRAEYSETTNPNPPAHMVGEGIPQFGNSLIAYFTVATKPGGMHLGGQQHFVVDVSYTADLENNTCTISETPAIRPYLPLE